jgi:hypothetical protein
MFLAVLLVWIFSFLAPWTATTEGGFLVSGLAYTESIFPPEVFAQLQLLVKEAWSSPSPPLIEANCNLDGAHRSGGYVSRASALYPTLGNSTELWQWLRGVTGQEGLHLSDLPLEIREYGPGSGGMPCHGDLQLYAGPSVEVVLTIFHSEDSPSTLTWYDEGQTPHSLRPAPNSALAIRPLRPVHCVSGTGSGSRVIIKIIAVKSLERGPHYARYRGKACRPGHANLESVQKRRATGLGT